MENKYNEHGDSNGMNRRGFVNRLAKFSAGSALALALLPNQENNQAKAQTASKNLRTRQGNPTIENTNSQFFYAADYGVVADGVTDDGTALQACADAVMANNGGTIVLPDGVVLIGSVMVFSADYVPAARGSNITIQGGKNTDLKFTVGGVIGFGGLGNVKIQDLNVVGTSNATLCSDLRMIGVFSCNQFVMDNCRFYGIGTSAAFDIFSGCIFVGDTQAYFNNLWFCGCSAPNSAIITLKGAISARFNRVQFVDLSDYKGITYTTVAKAVGRAWIQIDGVFPLGGGLANATFTNCGFDEAPLWAIYADATNSPNEYFLSFEDTGFLNGLDYGDGVFSRALFAKNFKKVTFNRVNAYWQNNNTEYNPMEFDSCNLVELNDFGHRYGAKYIKLSGTTKRVNVRNSNLNCSENFPNGFQNTANALIDSDCSVSTSTTSDNTLVPTGLFTRVTGETKISSIMTTNFKVGDSLTLILDKSVTVTNRTDDTNLKLAGNFDPDSDSLLVLKFDGTNFYEISRSFYTV